MGKGKGEFGRAPHALARAQIPPSPSPFNATQANLIGLMGVYSIYQTSIFDKKEKTHGERCIVFFLHSNTHLQFSQSLSMRIIITNPTAHLKIQIHQNRANERAGLWHC